MPIIETERLYLREFTVDDSDALYRMRSEPEIMRYVHEEPLASPAKAREAILAYPDYREYGYGRWACVLRRTTEAIGFAGLKYLPERDEVDVGYRFFPEYWRRGYATEAARASIRYAFGVLALEEVCAFVLPENLASIRVLEKSGMHSTGTCLVDGIEAQRYAIGRDQVLPE